MPKLLKLSAIVTLAVISAAIGPCALAGAVIGATEPTQILNNIELVAQEANQVQMVANQLKNLSSLPITNWGQASSDLSQLANIVSNGQQINYQMQNVNTAFQQQYPGYKAGANFTQSYQQLGTNSLDNIRAALSAAGLQSQQFSSERAALSSIQAMANNPLGQVQAIQAGTMIASQQVDQMQKMRQLMMAQMQAQDTYIAGQTQNEQSQAAAEVNHFQIYQPTAPTFSSAGGSN